MLFINEQNLIFIGSKLEQLRKTNGISQQQLALLIGCDKSVISKVENGRRKDVRTHVEAYVRAMRYPLGLIDEIMRLDKIAVPDTSALLYNPRLIDDLCGEYSKVVVPDIIIRELQIIKDKKLGKKSRQAWEVLRSISEKEKIVTCQSEKRTGEKNDISIIRAVMKAANEFKCSADIITNDTDYSALLKNNDCINAVSVKDYMHNRYHISNMLGLIELDGIYLDDYNEYEIPKGVNVNEYLPNGNTLIISAVRDTKHTLVQKKAKIEWLIKNGADVDRRDCSERFFPPLTHAIQIKNGYEMFIFLLKKCNANPNVGNRNPFSTKYLRQQNEGNMPLMVAAWHGKDKFVRALCSDERTSINQQDSNGYTALIKAAIKNKRECCRILLEAGADTKIVDFNEHTAADYFDYVADYIESRCRKND